MQWGINSIAGFVRAGRDIAQHAWVFTAVFGVVFAASVATLAHFDLLPQAPTPLVVQTPVVKEEAPAPASELPVLIEIPALGRTATIANPTSVRIADLDEQLLHGAVRYPTSAKLGEMGNVVLFGHSSYLPVVGNQAYKTFNGIQKLAVGDEIRVSSVDRVYVYRVRTVENKNAKDDGISLAATGKVLTLSTCNSFKEKADRFVVTADFVESHPLSS